MSLLHVAYSVTFANWISVVINIITTFNLISVYRGGIINHVACFNFILLIIKKPTNVEDAFIRKLEYNVRFDCMKDKKMIWLE